MRRLCALLLVSCWSIIASAKECPDPLRRQDTVGDNKLHGFVVRHANRPSGEVVKPAKITVYAASGRTVYTGVTGDHGEFGTGVLPAGDYRIVVDGLGTYHVKLDPKLDMDGGIGNAGDYTLRLADQGCVSHSENTN